MPIASDRPHALPPDLGDGLRLRRATPADPAAPDPAQAAQNADLLTRPHPTFGGRAMTVVEEARTGRLVSSQHLGAPRRDYGGLPFPIGEIEHVATDPDDQRRGLVRARADLIHRWSAAQRPGNGDQRPPLVRHPLRPAERRAPRFPHHSRPLRPLRAARHVVYPGGRCRRSRRVSGCGKERSAGP